VKKGTVHYDESLMPYNQATEIAEPGKGTFHVPALAIVTQFATILGFHFLTVAGKEQSNQF